ncbi:MAG TPA: Yip1 family protein [Steroidobacteraceae bacterium]|nr:Yip1 family protein [Steroidobacteraceae bacterium]
MDINKIIARAKSILLTPKSEWPVIATEPETIAGLFSGYIAIMAAIPPLVHLVSASLIGVSVPFLGAYRIPIGSGLTIALISYVLSLVGVFVVALIVEALAPTFGGEKNRIQALKVVAYSYTAGWVASIIGIIPGLGLIAALAGLIYGLYLLNLGLPFTMKCPADKSLGYTIVTIIVAIIVAIVLNLVVRSVGGYGYGAALNRGLGGYTPSGRGAAGGFASGSAGAALQDWSKRMQDASKQVDAAQQSGDATAKANAVGQLVGAALGSGGKVQSLSPDRIKPFLPDTLAGLPRTQASAERNAALGVQISKATATYSDGANHHLNLEITDTGSLKGLVGFAAGWGGVEQESESDNGYEKTYLSGSQLMHEKWDKQSQSGEFGVVIADRFSVVVTGNGSSIDDLKQAAASVNASGLQALKNEGVTAGN